MQRVAKLNNEYIAYDQVDSEKNQSARIKDIVLIAFKRMPPIWPLKNVIAVNPLQGFEDLPFEQAIEEGRRYFQRQDIPARMHDVNRESIKWCQAFFDEGQATIAMPYRDLGLYRCFKMLAKHDSKLHQFEREKSAFLNNLPENPEEAILICLRNMGIRKDQHAEFMSLLLTTLPGWSGYVKYLTDRAPMNAIKNPVTQVEYLAVRIIITYLVWPGAVELYTWHIKTVDMPYENGTAAILEKIYKEEASYRSSLLSSLNQYLNATSINNKVNPQAQLVFCIDVRSEPYRRAIESFGRYETFGFAGFFGVPVHLNNELIKESYDSCPVLLSSRHVVNEHIACDTSIKSQIFKKKQGIDGLKQLYQQIKYMFTTPFILVEAIGLWSGIWMLLKTIVPKSSTLIKNNTFGFSQESKLLSPILDESGQVCGINFNDQCTYAESFLRLIGLTQSFSPYIILCGHGAQTENNAYASALDCGACGGHGGAPNARILASILNNKEIRKYLSEKNICIPDESMFIAGLHNTTTDEITLYVNKVTDHSSVFKQLQADLISASRLNSESRLQKLLPKAFNKSLNSILCRSADWAQTRPEWGLAQNASFIIGPRPLTKDIDLDGRAFLHSYDWRLDNDGSLLRAILTAPMIVAQWINSQYFFSTLDNITYGSGSKITHNITGKMGVMQGNSSDLMHGLPLQSIYQSDRDKYHQLMRLSVIVYAPLLCITDIISKESKLQTLFKNAWLSLICLDPTDNMKYILSSDLNWELLDSH